MAILRKKADPAREELRAVLARKAELETRLERLRAGRADANDKLGKAVVAVRQAEAAFDTAYSDLARETVAAIAEGREAPAGPNADALRAAVGAAEAERRGYEATVRHLGDEIAALEDSLTYMPMNIDAAQAAVAAPLVRRTLDHLYQAETATLQARAELDLLVQRKLIPSELAREVSTAQGLEYGQPAGFPGSPIAASNVTALADALAALRNDPDAELPGD